MGLVDFLKNAAVVTDSAMESFKFREFLKNERDLQTAAIAEHLSTLSPATFEVYESKFLLYSVAVPDIHLRLRAIELYAYAKHLANQKFGAGQWSWSGFLAKTSEAHRGVEYLPWE